MIDQKPNQIIIEDIVEHNINDERKVLSEKNAVQLRNVVFGYRKAIFFSLILNDININVKQGQIYALLGPSGCGKTTLLRNILGRLKPRSGSVKVFGIEPNTNESSVPGLNHCFFKSI